MDIRWQNTIHIRRPVAQVYGYLSQFPRHVEWAQTLARLEQTRSGDSNGVGTTYLTHERQAMQTDRAPNAPIKKVAMPAQTVCEVTALQPNQRIAWRSAMSQFDASLNNIKLILEAPG